MDGAGKCGRELARDCMRVLVKCAGVLSTGREALFSFKLFSFKPWSCVIPSLNVKAACCCNVVLHSVTSDTVQFLPFYDGRDQVWVQVVNGMVTSFPECFCGLSFGIALNWTRLLSTYRLFGRDGNRADTKWKQICSPEFWLRQLSGPSDSLKTKAPVSVEGEDRTSFKDASFLEKEN